MCRWQAISCGPTPDFSAFGLEQPFRTQIGAGSRQGGGDWGILACGSMSTSLRVLRASRPPPAFGIPDFVSPLDLQQALQRVPPSATGKGMFVAQLLEELDRHNLPRPTKARFFPFSDYPLTVCMELNMQIARLLFPRRADREALRRVAWRSFGIFAESLVGKILFGALRHEVMAVLQLAALALSKTTNVGTCQFERVDERTALLHVTEAYMFAEPFGAGMLEGLLQSAGQRGQVLVQMTSPTSGAFFVQLEDV